MEVFQINPKNHEDGSTEAGFVPMANISDGFADKYSYEVKPWKSIKSGFTHFRNGDIAVAKISPCLENRKSFVVRGLPQGIGAGTTELFVFRSGQIIPEYGLLFFKSEFFISNCVGTFNGVVGQQRVGRSIIEEMPFPIPPIAEQERIVQRVGSIFKMITEVDNNQSALEDSIGRSKVRILDLAIHGKLVPQDPLEEPAIELLKRINPNFKASDNLHYQGKLPNGWTCATFDDIFDTIPAKPHQVLMSEIKRSGTYPVISQGANYIDGYSDCVEKHLAVTNPIIIFGDHSKVLKYVDFDFIVGADGVKILVPRVLPKYAYYHLQQVVSQMDNRGYSRNFQYLSSNSFFVPPFKEQKRIVSAIEQILTALSAITK